MMLLLQEPAAATTTVKLNSVFDMIVNGGPLMIPIALCSIISFAYVVERTFRLREGELGNGRFGKRVLDELDGKSPDSTRGAVRLCEDAKHSMGRILGAGLKRSQLSVSAMEKAVEDAGRREVKRLSAGLKPLVLVGMIAPLLGLLGTVWGMIESFSSIALQDGLGKPELLAAGISQALITTAAGLTVAIPTQAAYFWFKAKIDRFVRRVEDLYAELETKLLPGAPLAETVRSEA